MESKRNFVRYIIEAKVRFKTVGDIPKSIEGQVLDIGFLGWGVFLKESIDINTIIQFDLTTNFLEQHLQGSGKIVYVQQQKVDGNSGFRVGVEFIEVDKDIVLMFINEKQRVDSQERKRAFEAERRRQQTRASEFGPY